MKPLLCMIGLHLWYLDPRTLKTEPHPNRFKAAHGVTITTYIHYCSRCPKEIRREDMGA